MDGATPPQLRGAGTTDVLVTHVGVVSGGIRDEQYRIDGDRAIAIHGREIAWIGPTADAPVDADRVIDGRGMLAVPGLINTHDHLFQNLVKGLGDEMPLLPWVEMTILATAEAMAPEDTYAAALLGCCEAIRSGTTGILDFMFGLPDPDQHRAVLRAFRDSGIRGFLGRATRELNIDSGHRDPWYIPLDEVFDQIRFLSREFPSGLDVPSVMPAPGTVRTMTTEGLVRVKEHALAEGSQLTIHMGEYDEERDLAMERWGMSIWQKTEEIGFLGPDVVAAHCVKLDAEDIEIVARTRTNVSWNPVSNGYLGVGIAPIPAMLEQGAQVSLATDGGACGNTQDMIEALRFGAIIQRAAQRDPRTINARDMLRIATAGGARALGLDARLGALEPGRLADFFLFDPYRLKSVPVHDPISSIVWAGAASNVDTVIVDGQVVLDGGRFPTIDEEALVREVDARAQSLSRQVGTARLTRGRRFTPYGADRDAESRSQRQLKLRPESDQQHAERQADDEPSTEEEGWRSEMFSNPGLEQHEQVGQRGSRRRT